MKKFLVLTISVLLVACNPLAKLPTIQTDAETAFNNNNYQKAYTLYHQYIDLAKSNNAEVSDDIYLKVAQSAGQIDKIDEASQLYSSLIEKDDYQNLITEYANLLQKNNKVTEEIKLWESTESDDATIQKQQNERLLELYSSTESYDSFISTYANKGDMPTTKETTMAYVNALDKTGNTIEAAKECNSLVRANPDYVDALEWKGKYYYEKAETRYKAEMAAYNKNKNATTYAYLKRDLKKISGDFRISRDTFEKLHQLQPEEQSHIRYLKNCYLRLDQKTDAAKMDRLLD